MRLRSWVHTVKAVPASDLMDEAAAEIERLSEAIRRLADQDAALSVCDGRVTVTMDATITDEEREAIRWFAGYGDLQSEARRAEVLAGLLKRLS